MLAYNLATDACDEYFKMRKLTTMEALKRFCKAVNVLKLGYFGSQIKLTLTSNYKSMLIGAF
jgi:hypothetical protein